MVEIFKFTVETAVRCLDLEMDESWKKIRSELKSKLDEIYIKIGLKCFLL